MQQMRRIQMSNLKKPELLAPAGDLEKLKIAVLYGADAVYIGGRSIQPESKSKKFQCRNHEGRY